jgi:uncharacterized protein YbjT (DUF2867 family)
MKLMIVGSTGLVGSHALDLALADPRVGEVVAPVRRPLPERPKLRAPLIDYERLPEDSGWWGVDAVICALGTTMKTAGTRDAFRRVDHDHPLAVARLARKHGARIFALNSAAGADPGSPFFYCRVKGDLERDLTPIGYESLTLVRPGLIGGDRAEFRLGERIASVALGVLGPILPRRLRVDPAGNIARALLEAAIGGRPGVHVVGAAELT